MTESIGVSAFELTQALPQTLESSLPSIGGTERELEGDKESSSITCETVRSGTTEPTATEWGHIWGHDLSI